MFRLKPLLLLPSIAAYMPTGCIGQAPFQESREAVIGTWVDCESGGYQTVLRFFEDGTARLSDGLNHGDLRDWRVAGADPLQLALRHPGTTEESGRILMWGESEKVARAALHLTDTLSVPEGVEGETVVLVRVDPETEDLVMRARQDRRNAVHVIQP